MVVIVIVAVPGPTAVTTPFSSTVTTLVSLDVKLTPLLEAFDGSTVKLMVAVSPSLMVNVGVLTFTPVTRISVSLFLQELTDSAVTPSATTAIAVMTLVINLLRVIVYGFKNDILQHNVQI